MNAEARAVDATLPASAPVRIAQVSAGEIYGGIERFIATFSRHLYDSKQGVPWVILFSEGRLADELRHTRIPIRIAPFSTKYDPRLVSWLSGLLKDEMIDVVHAHGFKAGVIAGLASRLTGVPAVKTEHGAMEPFSGLSGVKMRANLALDGFVTRLCVEETVYITQNLQSAKALRGKRGSRVIPNGIAPIDGTLSFRHSRSERFRIGIVGRLSPVKGHATLFDACRLARHRDLLDVHVYGSGPLEDELRRKAESEMPGRITFHGFSQNVVDEMASLDCLAMPSWNEGLPYTLLEAMHLGLPIVASSVGGMKEVLHDGETALLAPAGNAEALAARIDALVEDTALAAKIGTAAQRDARDRFGIEKMTAQYLQLYREVLR